MSRSNRDIGDTNKRDREIVAILSKTIAREFGQPLVEQSRKRIADQQAECQGVSSSTNPLVEELAATITAIFGPIVARRIVTELNAYLEPFTITEIFLIDNSGCLLRHISDQSSTGLDTQLMSGMFTAIKDFVQVSFTSRPDPAGLRKLHIGTKKLLVVPGEHTYLTVLYTGHMPREREYWFEHFVEQLERQYDLANRDLDTNALAGLDTRLKNVFSLD